MGDVEEHYGFAVVLRAWGGMGGHLGAPHLPMTGAQGDVAEANARFYRAFETLDLAAMERVWAHGEHVKCVHPGWPLLTGWDAVRESWRAIFTNTQEMRFTISDLRVEVAGAFAWATCTENILSEVRGRISVASVLATNLFERGPDGWVLVHHHASPVLAAAAPE